MSRRDPWFKFYPSDWLRDTRELSLEQRGAYIDAICIHMERNGPIPDDMTWLAHQMHISKRKAQAIVEQLLEAKMLNRTGAGLTNSKCEKVIAERDAQRKIAAEAAINRERTKRESALNQRRTDAEPETNQARKIDENSEKHNEINKTEADLCHEEGTTRARSRNKKEDIRPIEGPYGPSNGEGSEDFPPARAAKPRAEGDASQQAYHLGEQINRGRIKLTQAERARQTEECAGIEYVGGKLSVFNGTALELIRDFPGIDLNAVCNRAAPDVAKLRNPTPDQMLAAVRRHAQFAADDANKHTRRQSIFSKPKDLHAGLTLEQRARIEAALSAKRGAH
jgi:uncharacterized protein YdaU (DUF1376 family)